VLAEKHTKEEWVYLFHTWKIQVGSPSAVPCDPAIQGLISAMKPAAKRVCLEEPLGISTNLNFNDFSTSMGDIGMDDLASVGEPEPDLVLLSSTSSSEDKTQEECLEDMMHAWDSLVHTVKTSPVRFVLFNGNKAFPLKLQRSAWDLWSPCWENALILSLKKNASPFGMLFLWKTRCLPTPSLCSKTL
jgi:hypothetical protein